VPLATTIATTAPAVAVLVAVIFGTLTILQWQRSRYLHAAAELVHTIQTAEFTRSIALIVELPETVRAPELVADKELMTALYTVSHTFESLGVLVYHRMLPLHLVDHLIGGYVRASWKRARPLVELRRETLGAMFGEWFQWLAERLEEHPAPGKREGAAIAFKRWRP
jgi:hypothetical protein